MRIAAIFVLCAASEIANADTFPACILDDMPGAENDIYAKQVAGSCIKKHPGGYNAPETQKAKGSRPGIFPYKDGAACTLKKAKGTTSPYGAMLIQAACYHLYEPTIDLEQFVPAKK